MCYLTDAFASDALVPAVLSCLNEQASLSTEEGEIRFVPTARLAGLALPAEAETRDGVATTIFTAGSTAGTAQIAAESGGAIPLGETGTNFVEITIGN